MFLLLLAEGRDAQVHLEQVVDFFLRMYVSSTAALLQGPVGRPVISWYIYICILEIT